MALGWLSRTWFGVIGLSLGGCTPSGGPRRDSSEMQRAPEPSKYLQKELQQAFVKEIGSDASCTRAWAIYSYSGWSNNGHVQVRECGGKIEVQRAKPDATEFKQVDVGAAKREKFLHNIDGFAKLADFQMAALDGVEFQVIFLAGTPPSITKSIYMNNPQHGDSNLHQELVKFFYDLTSP